VFRYIESLKKKRGEKKMPNKNLKQKILELRARGKTYKQISQETPCAISTIQYWLKPNIRNNAIQRAKKNPLRKNWAKTKKGRAYYNQYMHEYLKKHPRPQRPKKLKTNKN